MQIHTATPWLAAALLASTSGIASAQDHHGKHDHDAHEVITKEITHAGHTMVAGDAVPGTGAGKALEAYRDALIALDLEAAGKVFADDSLIYENGKAEGSWADYAQKHLGPELGHFHSMAFPSYELELRQQGHFAFGSERFSYRIELHDGRVIEREGVATSVLRHGEDGWKIISYHSSSRAPKP